MARSWVRRARVLCLVWACFVVSGGAAPADNSKPAVLNLNGKWMYDSQAIGGWELPRERRDEIWIEIKDGAFFRCGKSGLRQEMRLTLDAAREPAEFTLAFKHPITGKISESKGIYDLCGDRLTLCYDNSGRTRPAKFESPEGRDEIVLSVFKRSKE